MMLFDTHALLAVLQKLPRPKRYRVAYSGGRDSHVLLHALAQLRDQRLLPAPLSCVHVDHGLQTDAGFWATHCASVAIKLGIPHQLISLRIARNDGRSLEEAAREDRYQALRGLVEAEECLLTAHHEDDQAETVLLQLLRGCGVAGLAAMPPCMPFGPGWLARPLLQFDRQSLAAYAAEQQLDWVEDPSNRDEGRDRNYLRHNVIPALRQQWPALGGSLSRSARHCGEATHLLRDIATQDLGVLFDPVQNTLDTMVLEQLPAERQVNVLRHWIRLQGMPVPDSRHVKQILQEVVQVPGDRKSVVKWGHVEVRRFHGQLHVIATLPHHDPSVRMRWDPRVPLELPSGLGLLKTTAAEGAGLSAAKILSHALEVGFRQGGERLRPRNRGCTRSLKKLLQEQAVPPWLRERIPLVYVDGELAAVAELWVADKFAAGEGEAGMSICWRR